MPKALCDLYIVELAVCFFDMTWTKCRVKVYHTELNAPVDWDLHQRLLEAATLKWKRHFDAQDVATFGLIDHQLTTEMTE